MTKQGLNVGLMPSRHCLLEQRGGLGWGRQDHLPSMEVLLVADLTQQTLPTPLLESLMIQSLASHQSVKWDGGGMGQLVEQRAPKFHQLQIPSRTKFRRPYPSRAKYGGYDTKSIQNGLIWALKWLIYTLFELKSVNIRGVNLIMALYLPELT